MDQISLLVSSGVFWLVFSIFAAPLYWIVIAVAPFMRAHLPDPITPLFGLIFIFGTQFLIARLARKAAHHREAGSPFFESASAAVREVRMELGLLPVVGKWLAPKP